MNNKRQRQRRWASHVLMMASGFAAIGYEVVWTQKSSSWLGHESAAVLAVVAAFFGGLALGGLALGGPERLASLGLEDELAVLGSMIAGPGALSRFADGAILNTDDHPIVAYSAPHATYAPDATPRDRLIELVRELSIEPTELVLPVDPKWRDRLAACWKARDLFVESGRDVRPSASVTDMLAQVREPLLSVLRISPDFRPAYDPLLAMATALARTDVAAARMLLGELRQTQPARSEAAQLLARLRSDASTDP